MSRRFAALRRLVVSWLLVLGACPNHGDGTACDEPSADAGEAAFTEVVMTGGAGCMGVAHIGECCCYEPPKGGGLAACVTEYLCPEIELTCPHDDVTECSRDELELACGAGVDCALAALAGERVGGLQWRVDSSTTPGLSQSRVGLFLAGDGTAITVVQSDYDVDPIYESVEQRTLQPPSYFSECMAETSALARFNCMRTAFVGLPQAMCE